MPTMTPEQAAIIITTAYKQLADERGDWVALSRIWRAPVMEAYDMSLDELAEGCRYLDRTDRGAHIIPEANQKGITTQMREASFMMGGQRQHHIGFDHTSSIWR